MQLGYFSAWNAGKVQHVSGFSQKVALGDIGAIQEDAGLAMRVRVTQLKGFANDRFYWRGVSFDHYDGKSWTNAASAHRFLFQDSDGFFYNSPDRRTSDVLIKEEFYVEPIDTRVIFGADRIVKLKGDFNGVSKDGNSGLTAMSRPQTYEVYSRIPRFSRDVLRKSQSEPPEYIKRFYLQLPYKSDKIDALARSIIGNNSTQIDQILSIKSYLEQNYRYTTSNLPQDAQDPISNFLFENKAGHCEYFATAMVLLLRHAGIPARIVNGFLQGEYNEIGGFYAVRNSDAHSWVEAFVGGMWAPFDPSPRPASGAEESLSAFLSLRKVFDSVGFFWDRYVLIFSAQDQIDALTATREQYRKLKDQFKSGQSFPALIFERILGFSLLDRKDIVPYLAGGLLLLLLILRFRRRRQRERVTTTPVLFYQEMLSILRRKGFRKRPQITPKEFLEDIAEHLPPPSKSDVDFLTDLFYKSRFGQYPLSDSDANSVHSALERLEQLN
jgi:transglutaminase-like putative cysteine protease